MNRHLQIELAYERQIARRHRLAAFRRNATTWELLLLLAANNGESDLGVYNTLDQLETGYLGQSAMLKFLRDRRTDGLLTFDEHEKRSKWRLRLAPELHADLRDILEQRNRNLADTDAETDKDAKAGPAPFHPGFARSIHYPQASTTRQ